MPVRRAIVALFALIFVVGCSIESDERWQYDAMGEVGDLAVLTDQMTWGKQGNLIDSIFAQNIPGMAGAEPFFVVRKCDESKFDGFYKQNYNLFVFIQRDRWHVLQGLFSADLQSKIEGKFNPNSLVVFKLKDVWARPQEVHFVLVPNDSVMAATLKNKRASFLLQALETEGITTVTTLLNNQSEKDTFLQKMLKTKGYGVRMPFTYKVGVRSNECMGITRYMNAKKLGLYLYDEPYVSERQFTNNYIIARRNNVLKEHIHGTDRPDSLPTFMSTDTINVKVFRRQMELNGFYAIETRGWWEMENDFMAGPFVNYTILSTKSNRVISIDGNVFAPGHDKNRLIRQLELIAATFEEKE